MPKRRSRLHPFLVTVGGRVVAWLLRALGATWRLRTNPAEVFEGEQPFVGALWHRGLFIAAYAFRDRRAVIPVSRSRDGDRIAEVLKRLGYGPSPRGSSSRGATSLLSALIRVVRGGACVGVLCDGPRGPVGELKPGVLAVARATGTGIVPVGLAASPCLRFGSWDRVLLPLPFARVACAFGPTLRVPRQCDRGELERLRVQLTDEINRQEERAVAHLDGRPAAAD